MIAQTVLDGIFFVGCWSSVRFQAAFRLQQPVYMEPMILSEALLFSSHILVIATGWATAKLVHASL